MSFTIGDKIVLITGASSGLGRHFAEVCVEQGAAVAVAARRVDMLDELCKTLAERGGRVLPVALDVTDSASINAAVATVVGAWGGIDVLINNAGVALTQPVLDVTEQDWDTVLDTNLKGAWLVAQATAKAMIAAKRGGSIINIASITGLRVAGQIAPYAISKAGVIHLTKVLALELSRYGIRVNALAPGYIETELNRAFFASAAGQKLIGRIPQRRLGQLRELDGPLLLLASEAASYMTGSVIAVDGGHLQSSL